MKSLLVTASMLAVLAITPQAFAADLAARTAPVYSKAPEYVAVSNWSGFYVGGNVGYGWGNGNSDVNRIIDDVGPNSGQNTFNDTPFATKSGGVIGGGQFGYNWQVGTFVTGFEADFQGSGVKGDASIPATRLGVIEPDVPLTASQSLSWFGTVRGRVGFTVIPDLLLYGTGGLAYGEVKDSGSFFDGDANRSVTASANSTRVGWTAGAGVEWKFARNWSAKVEYLHIDLGSVSSTAATIDNGIPTASWQNHFDTVRAGVNYHFN